MAFSDQEKLGKVNKLAQQILGSADASPGEKFDYNEIESWSPIVPLNKIWNLFYSIPGAATPLEADNAVALNPSFLEKRKIRLTLDVGSNQRSYQARSVYGDLNASIYENWIQPSLIRDGGANSPGYIIRVFHGDPDSGGTELSTTYLSGVNGENSWEWNYSQGIFKVSTDQRSTYYSHYITNGLWVLGYRYIGDVGGGGSGQGTLNQAYNSGGPGDGRSISVLANKPVEFNASGNCGLYIDGYFTLKEISTPSPRTNSGNIYTKEADGKTELFYMDDVGASTQITADGYLATANSLTRVGLYEHNYDPPGHEGEGFLYAKPVGQNLELFFMDNKGRAIQITKDGALNLRGASNES